MLITLIVSIILITELQPNVCSYASGTVVTTLCARAQQGRVIVLSVGQSSIKQFYPKIVERVAQIGIPR